MKYKLAKSTKQKSTGKDSGNLPNTTNKAGGLSKSALNFPLSTSRPKPKKIEYLPASLQYEMQNILLVTLANKIDEQTKVINYLIDKI